MVSVAARDEWNIVPQLQTHSRNLVTWMLVTVKLRSFAGNLDVIPLEPGESIPQSMLANYSTSSRKTPATTNLPPTPPIWNKI